MNDPERTSLAEGLERIIAHLERARRDGFRVVMHRATLAMEPAPDGARPCGCHASAITWGAAAQPTRHHAVARLLRAEHGAGTCMRGMEEVASALAIELPRAGRGRGGGWWALWCAFVGRPDFGPDTRFALAQTRIAEALRPVWPEPANPLFVFSSMAAFDDPKGEQTALDAILRTWRAARDNARLGTRIGFARDA